MGQPSSANRVPERPDKPLREYVALGALFVVAVAYQALVTRDLFHGILHPQSEYEFPFGFDRGTATINGPGVGAQAGLHRGDLLVAVDGVPYVGSYVFDEAITRPHPDAMLTVTVRSAAGTGSPAERTLRIPLTNFVQGGDNTRAAVIFRLIVYLLMPWFCLILGFWVAAVRPRDRLAWLLLGLMLGFTQLLGVSTGQWGPGIRDLARVYHLTAGNFWSLAMLLFGLYFPEPFPEKKVHRWWRWFKWTMIVLISAANLPGIFVKTIEVENYAAVADLSRRLAPLDAVSSVLDILAVSAFFSSIFAKGTLAVSRDAKRRLRLLYFGSSLSLTPIFIAVMVGIGMGKGGELGFLPGWLLFTVLLLLFLFPLTLAYTIVVQRAMEVRVAVRQGLQYALARGGISAFRMIFTAGAIAGAVYLLQEHSNINSPLFYIIILATILVGVSTRRIGNRLRAWTDRRFFRDAYDSEVILSELSDKVRTIFETQPLLATVSHRIAESLHVPRVAVLIDGSGPYRPAYALGYSEPPPVVFLESAGTVRQLVETGEPTRVYSDDPDSWLYRRADLAEDERRQLQQLGSELLLPLSAQDHLLGFISLGQKRSEEPYTGSDLRLLKSVASQTGLALENSRLTATVAREVAQREKLNRELEIAREVQQRLFPQKVPAVPGLDYCGACRPALGVGGDYYDFLELPDRNLGLALGDVSGKGIAAALMMATLQASLRGEAMRGSSDLGQMIGGVNRLVFEASTSNRYATFFYAEYEPNGRTLNYVNAGHNPPMLFRKNGEAFDVLRLEVGGTVIGLLERFPFQQASITLELGDMLVLYTDGVSEAMNPEDEEWGEARMMETLERCHGLGAQQTLEYTMTAADAFASGAPQHDDMTLVVLRVI
jgi:sigma-B regulation protein RsbU (phosphoserine phosphatase)